MPANLGKLPMFLYGSADLVSGWSASSGNLVITGGQADPFGGTDAAELDDQSAGEAGYAEKVVTVPTGVSSLVYWHFVKKGSVYHQYQVFTWQDTTAATSRRNVKLDIDNKTLTHLFGTDPGLDFLIDDTNSDWLAVRIGVTGIVPANSNRVRIYPAAATQSDLSPNGKLIVYRRNVVIPRYPLHQVRAWSRPGAGSEQIVAMTGVKDSWLTHREQLLVGQVRFSPSDEVANLAGTGWDGTAPLAGVYQGWRHFLEYMQEANTCTYLPNRENFGTYKSVYVDRPYQEEPAVEPDGNRTFELQLRASDAVAFDGY